MEGRTRRVCVPQLPRVVGDMSHAVISPGEGGSLGVTGGVEVRGGPAQREGDTAGAGWEGRLGKASCDDCSFEVHRGGGRAGCEAGRRWRQREWEEPRHRDGKSRLASSSPVSLDSFQQCLSEGLLCTRHGSALGGSSSLSDFASTGVKGKGGLSLPLGTAYSGEKA